jgi:hypothetical protein
VVVVGALSEGVGLAPDPDPLAAVCCPETPRTQDGTMTRHRQHRIRSFEGQTVSLALIDGTRLDDCQLVSACRSGTETLWIYENGTDHFVPVDNVVDLWGASGHGIAS